VFSGLRRAASRNPERMRRTSSSGVVRKLCAKSAKRDETRSSRIAATIVNPVSSELILNVWKPGKAALPFKP